MGPSYRISQAGSHRGSLVPPPCSSRAIPEHRAQGWVQMALECPQEEPPEPLWALLRAGHCPGQKLCLLCRGIAGLRPCPWLWGHCWAWSRAWACSDLCTQGQTEGQTQGQTQGQAGTDTGTDPGTDPGTDQGQTRARPRARQGQAGLRPLSLPGAPLQAEQPQLPQPFLGTELLQALAQLQELLALLC